MNRLLLVSALVLLAIAFIECNDDSKTQRKLANCKSKTTDIGDYSKEINGYNECGISMNTSHLESVCSQNKQQMSKRLNGVRDADFGEAPWVVNLEINLSKTEAAWCGGALITDQWILTAAHCLVNDDIKIYFDTQNRGKGPSIETVKRIKHPKFTNKPKEDGYSDYDIALIKLKQSINSVPEIDTFKKNIICLPSRQFSDEINDKYYKVATVSGIGPDHKQLQIGLVNVYKDSAKVLAQLSMKYGTIICQGDSGSSVWMYNMGKAFQIGVTSAITGVKESGLSYGRYQCSNQGMVTFLPDHIDWILETIKQ